ncbi:L-type lectin-domain containing receptor kinase SIT2-like [Miscanthus floridulus]|uniref:L-type lectin-domain containing receptor kinase SIT2-like n=1 Tax=Miscanthus floridulus TaxID=154761 RepID=UPI00345B3FD4
MRLLPCSFQFLHLLILVRLLSSGSGAGGAAVDHPSFIYDGFSGHNLIMDGQASVVDGLLRLTNDLPNSKGHSFYPYPLNFTDASNGSSLTSFSTTFIFSIMGPYTDLSTHGLTFVLCSTKDFSDALPSQYLGLLNSTNDGNATKHLLAIELDTIMSTEFNDIDSNHIGIDINSLHSVASSTAGYYTSAGGYLPLSLNSGQPMQVWVDYDSKQTMVNVTIAPFNQSKPSRPLLTQVYDLSTILPTTPVFAGFSSATGTLRSRHYILGWSFRLNGEAAALDYSALSLKTIQDLAAQIGAPPSMRINRTILFAALVSTLGVAIVVSATLFKIHRKRRLEARRNEIEWEREYGPPSFTYKDLCAATGGFKDKMLLGKGGFGSVFKGLLPHSKQTVAIKRISPESKQGMKEFMAEIIILGRLRHRNLVQLLGYCRHKQQLLLVYDYMPHGSLDFHLHIQGHSSTGLCWSQRFHILKCIASGIFYLHEECEQVVIHRDIKTSNVLLDSEMNARLGDFGLARSHDHGADAHTTHVAGTWGYIAPELARLGKATKATDVFALGVLMMEVACGKRPIWVNNHGEPLALGDWVLKEWQGGSITNAVDPRLDDHVEEEIELVLKLGLLCSHPLPNARPSMRLVMQYLQRDAHLPSELGPNSLLNIGLVQDQMLDQHAMSCPATVITDLSKGR